jgi:hypothetical protein
MDCARSARTQSRIESYSSHGMVKAPVGELRLIVFAVTDQVLDTDLDNVAITKHGQKVRGLLIRVTGF